LATTPVGAAGLVVAEAVVEGADVPEEFTASTV
jgi:hypothetical protein